MGKLVLLCHIGIVFINLISLTIAQEEPGFLRRICNDNSSIRVYQSNRDTLLSSLSLKTDQYGFYTSSTGKDPDKVYALVLCRADVKLDACRECINNSVAKIKELCPDAKEAIEWYDNCTLRYSNVSMKGIMEGEPSIPYWNDKKNVTSVDQFKDALKKLLENLRDEAASAGSHVKFASGNVTGPDSQSIYALAQCTPDLSKQDCRNCIQGAIDDMPKCCEGPAGGRILRPSCHYRFELGGPFFGDPVTGGCRGLKGRLVSVAAALLNFIALALVLN